MPEPLTLDRFRALAEAYGGSLARWPDGDRAAAAAMADDPACRAVLQAAAALDGTLDLMPAPHPPAALVERIVRSGPAGRRILRSRPRLLWPAVGLAAALAGLATGSLAMASLTPPDVSGDIGTVFGDVAGPWS